MIPVMRCVPLAVVVVVVLVVSACGGDTEPEPSVVQTSQLEVIEPATTASGLSRSLLATSASVVRASEDTEPPPLTATTVPSTTVVSSSTTAARPSSPAWVGSLEQDTRVSDLSFDTVGIVKAHQAADYALSNPNVWTTPMGTLCWADFEINRTADMAYYRQLVDHNLILAMIRELDLTVYADSNPGPATSRTVIAVMEGYTTTTTTAGATPSPGAEFANSEIVNMLWLLDRWGGSGTEFLDALDAVASPGWAAAVRAGDGLPADVLVYADGLAANAREILASGDPEISVYKYGAFVDGYRAFVELAKYDQNCLRARIGDPPPPLPDIPALTTTTTEVGATTTTLRSGSVRVRGADLNGLMTPGEAGLGVGYSRSGDVGSFDDTTFSHDGVGYEVERLLWWPNGTIRLDVYPDGLDAVVGDDGVLVITPVVDSSTEYVWDMADAQHLGGAADFVWDTEFVPNLGSLYRVELRIGVPDAPRNVGLSGTFVIWDAPSGGATVDVYHVWLRSVRPDGRRRSFYNVAAFEGEQQFEITYMVRFFGEELTVQVRSRNSAGYSPWTPPQTFATPGSSTTSTTVGSSTTSTTAA